jgi:hypothetical protein
MTEKSKAAAILGREGGKIGGRSKSPAKLAAAARNGKLGGWPLGKKRPKKQKA